MKGLPVLLFCAAVLCALPAAAGLISYVEEPPAPGEACPSARCDALGYPVPRPLDLPLPAAGFRSHAALHAHLQDLALQSGFIERHLLGQTAAGREIVAYRLGDADAQTADGEPEPAMLVNAAIHAREWAAPEVAAGLVERMAAQESDGGFYRYLLDNVNLVVVPTLNVDGLLQTQRYLDQALETEFRDPGQPEDAVHADPSEWPRDGRMRRKNMRCDAPACREGRADEALTPGGDGLYGTDNNRNNEPWYASGTQNSGDPRSLVYHGNAPGAERENQALYAAAALGPEPRLRLFVDLHAYSQAFFGVNTGNARRDRLAQSLFTMMGAAAGGRYGYAAGPAGGGIGSTDEYFSYRYQIPASTLEIEPESDDAYGGYGVSHAGFVLPEAEVPRVREELVTLLSAGLYRMAGPPQVQAAEIRRAADGGVVYAARWQRSGAGRRELGVEQTEALQAGTDYRLWLGFSKPMRLRDRTGAVTGFAGVALALAPALALSGEAADGSAFTHDLGATAAGWRRAAGGAPDGALRYADDAYALDFRLPDSLPLAGAQRLHLVVDAQDLSGQKLDADPATAVDLAQPPEAAAGGWLRYEDEQGRDDSDRGGADRTLVLAAGAVAAKPAHRGRYGAAFGAALLLGWLAWARQRPPAPAF